MLEYNTLSYKDFEIIQDLGRGSFGKVQLVRKKSDQKLYAIKSVDMTRLNQKQRDSALNEVRLLASINIPYVISYKGSFFNSQNQSLCVVMEYADGGDLQGKINSRYQQAYKKGFQEKFIWKVALQIFQGLKILHRQKIIHRDIKSGNIFFVEGIAKLGDLNVSKVLQNDMCSTQTGTPYYTSPQIWNGRKYGYKCDIWSTGCLIYEMCTLNPPFRANDFPTLFQLVNSGKYNPIPAQQYSEDLSKLISMCLTINQDLRPSAQEILQKFSGMKRSFEQFSYEQQNIKLINPIKCPQILKFIQNRLPPCQFEHKNKKTVGFSTKKQIQIDQYQAYDENFGKMSKKIRSEKIISSDQGPEERLDYKLASRNKVLLPPIQNSPDKALKFCSKKVRQVGISDKNIGSSQKIKLLEKQNCLKDNIKAQNH